MEKGKIKQWSFVLDRELTKEDILAIEEISKSTVKDLDRRHLNTKKEEADQWIDREAFLERDLLV